MERLIGYHAGVQLLTTVDQVPAEGLRFSYFDGPFEEQGLLFRLADGTVRAFKNECRHLPMRLDDRQGEGLWSADRSELVCAAHGARYRPSDGLCTAGPCRGSHLRKLPLVVHHGEVFLDTTKLGGFFAV